jgi:hypothetical protein
MPSSQKLKEFLGNLPSLETDPKRKLLHVLDMVEEQKKQPFSVFLATVAEGILLFQQEVQPPVEETQFRLFLESIIDLYVDEDKVVRLESSDVSKEEVDPNQSSLICLEYGEYEVYVLQEDLNQPVFRVSYRRLTR